MMSLLPWRSTLDPTFVVLLVIDEEGFIEEGLDMGLEAMACGYI